MEDVLDVYERPYDPKHPVVCVDELPYEMHGEAREPLEAKAGSDKKTDFEYVRHGTCSVFGAIEPLTGKCHVKAEEHRKKADLAHFLEEVAAFPKNQIPYILPHKSNRLALEVLL